jgi:uncharacterized protein (DUF1499 family)
MKKSKKVLLGVALVVVLSVAGLVMMSWFSSPPDDLGVRDGRLTDCPASPNCVCTQATSASHRMPPIPFTGDLASTRARLRRAIESIPRARFVEETDHYFRVEFTTAILRFVDDGEFLIDEAEKVIHFRSASRIGHSDLGANAKRMKAVRTAFTSDGAP